MSIRRLTVWILMVALLATPAFAEEPNGEDSAAARLFREGWWLETGAGALDRAKAKYEASVAAAGSDAIRGRALYRLGIVLQRMGHSEQAIKALERLQREFTKESKLVTQAKQRLEEWVGQDLRGSFEEWFKRYQYSPAFQAKVVDLVLTLGSADYQAANGAEAELLTIGEPAIEALRAHAISSKGNLPRRATEILWKLGVIPPAEALIKSTSYWTQNEERRNRILAHGGVRTDLERALANATSEHDKLLRAVLSGKRAVVDAYLAQDPKAHAGPPYLLRWACDTDLPSDVLTRLRALVVSDTTASSRRKEIMQALRQRPGYLRASEIQACMDSPYKDVYETAISSVNYDTVDGENTWLRLVDVIDKEDERSARLEYLTGTLLYMVGTLPADTDLSPAARVLARRIDASSVRNPMTKTTQWSSGAYRDNPQAVRLFESVISQASGKYVSSLLATFVRVGGDSDAVLAKLLEWSVSAEHVDVRGHALSEAARRISGDPSALFAALGDTSKHAALRDTFFNGLARNSQLSTIEWDAASIERLVQVAATYTSLGGLHPTHVSSGGTTKHIHGSFPGQIGQVFGRLFAEVRTRDLVLAVFASAPDVFPYRLLDYMHSDWARGPDGEPVGLRILRDNWERWSDEQKISGLNLCGRKAVILDRADDLRERAGKYLTDASADTLSLEVRRVLIGWVPFPKRTLGMIKACYDLTAVDHLDEALTAYGRAPSGPEELTAVYEAFAKVYEPDAPAAALKRFDKLFRTALQSDGALAGRATTHIQRCIARGDRTGAQIAFQHLATRNTSKDMDQWLALLKVDDANTRRLVVTQLGSLYTEKTVIALARLVDDPDPTIASTALKSLERIKATEEKKQYWRDFVEKGGR